MTPKEQEAKKSVTIKKAVSTRYNSAKETIAPLRTDNLSYINPTTQSTCCHDHLDIIAINFQSIVSKQANYPYLHI